MVLVRRSWTFGVLLAFASLVGCGDGGPPLSQVKGTVKYNGQPVDGAVVTFQYENGQMAVGSTDASGVYTLVTNGNPGAPLGKALVGVTKTNSGVSGDATSMKPEDMQKMQQKMMQQRNAAAKPSLPTKYQNPNSSGLTADVAAGTSEANFDLTD
ncbi:MAG: hypothetical protein U1A77_04355 [Pirellulales bacterium]